MKVGFIGAGKMAQAIALGLRQQGGVPAGDILASARTLESRVLFQEKVGAGVRVTESNQVVMEESAVIFLATKPQMAAEIIPPLQEASAGKLVVSVMAAIPLARLENWLHETCRVIRTMPNTPCLIGQGITGVVMGSRTEEFDRSTIVRLLKTIGQVAWVEKDEQLDAVTALSGSGPAYVYHFIEELIRAGEELGLPTTLARNLAIQTVLGAASMVEQTGESPGELAAKVKSPKGTTLAACAVLESRHWGEILRSAVAAAHARAQELARA